jgi:hypothetical protein
MEIKKLRQKIKKPAFAGSKDWAYRINETQLS